MKWVIRNIFFFLIIFLPFYSIIRAFLLLNNVQFILAPLSYLRDLVIILLILLSALFAFSKTKKIALKISPMTIGVIILLLNYIFGLIISIAYGNSSLILKAVHVSIIPILLYFFISIYKNNINELIGRFIKYIKLLGVVILIIAFIFYIFRPEFYLKLFSMFRNGHADNLIREMRYVRMVGPFFSPNVFATFMSIITIIFLNRYLYTPSRKRLIVILLGVLAVILSLSRGAWMFLFFGSVVSLYYWKGFNVWVSYLIKGFIALVLLLFILTLTSPKIFTVIKGRFHSLNITEGEAFKRSDNWKIVKEGFFKYPLGQGAGVGGQISAKDNNISAEIPVIDGFYIKTIAESGLIGILSLLIFLWLSIWQLRTSIKKANGEEKEVHIITFSILLGFCAQSVGSNPFDFITVAPYLWIFKGISNNIYIETYDKTGI